MEFDAFKLRYFPIVRLKQTSCFPRIPLVFQLEPEGEFCLSSGDSAVPSISRNSPDKQVLSACLQTHKRPVSDGHESSGGKQKGFWPQRG